MTEDEFKKHHDGPSGKAEMRVQEDAVRLIAWCEQQGWCENYTDIVINTASTGVKSRLTINLLRQDFDRAHKENPMSQVDDLLAQLGFKRRTPR